MISDDSIKSFIKEIVENGDLSNKEETKNLLENFKSYLEATTNISHDEINKISNLLDCLDEIFIIKEKLGTSVDIDSFLSIKKEDKPKVKEKKMDNDDFSSKHYGHYVNDTGGLNRVSSIFRCHDDFEDSSDFSSSCGSSFTGRSGC